MIRGRLFRKEIWFSICSKHQKHDGDCTVCHTKIFPQSRAPINYGKAQHRVAEAEGTACAFCHRVGGTSFAADSHCVKCHESQ